MPFFVGKSIRSQADTLTLVEQPGFATREAAEAAVQARLPAHGIVAMVQVVEAATAEEALTRASRDTANSG